MQSARRCCLAGLLFVAGLGPAGAETPDEIFDRGNRAYENGRFQEAAEAYRTVVHYGIEDAQVEYNLGNAEFKLGHLGEAILHYRRALRLDPTDRDVGANLVLVESYRVDEVEAPVPGPVLWARDLQNRVGPDRQGIAWIVLFWMAAALVAWCSARPGGWTAAAGWILSALLVLLVATATSWRVTYQRLEGQRLAVVLDESVEVLAGPGANNATLFTVHEGLTVEIRTERSNWLQVSLPNGLNGWLRRDRVGEV